MLKTVLLRLWQQVSKGFVRSKADEQLDEAEDFREFYQNECMETCRRLGYDVQLVEDDPGINPMNTAIWAGSGTQEQDDVIVSFKPAKEISMSQHLEANPELHKAHQAAIDDCLKRLNEARG